MKEAKLYWPLLRRGDLLGVHDYSDNPQDTGCEVFPADVRELQGKRIELPDTRILLLRKP